MTRAPVTVVVLTLNEERNLAACLASVHGWVEQIFVVDSGSTDGTITAARSFGAEVRSHLFESHATQWRWALDTLPISTEWVLGLDADQRVTPELGASITRTLSAATAGVDGYFVTRRQMFRGRWIRHGGYYPKSLLKMFRRSAVTVDVRDLVDHHFRVPGVPGTLSGDLIEDNQNEARIADWIAKHNRYARLQAEQEFRREPATIRARAFGHADERVQWRKTMWARLPLFVRPVAYFLYRYVLRLGFLDGREGFVFHFMQGLWYRMLVDINLAELRRERAARPIAVNNAVAVAPASGADQSLDPAQEAVPATRGEAR